MRAEPAPALALPYGRWRDGILAVAPAAVLALLWLAAETEGESRFLLYLAAMIAGFAVSVFPLARARNMSGLAVIGGAILAHLVLLLHRPLFEDDFFRYLWDGYRTIAAGSPYGIPPEAFFTDPAVPSAMRPILDGVNNPEAPTLYGPVLQGLFALGHLLAPTEERFLRGMFALANLGLILLLLRRFNPAVVALYAFNPLALTEIGLNGHPDGLIALFLAAGAGFAGFWPAAAGATERRRPILAGLAFAAAAGVKISALAVFPLLLFLPVGAWIAAGSGLIAAYAPFLAATPLAGLDGAAVFAGRWEFNPFFFAAAKSAFGDMAARMVSAFAGIGLMLVAAWKIRAPQHAAIAAIFGIALFFAPAVNAWYLLWVLPFALGTRWTWPWVASLALAASYATGLTLGREDLAAFALHPFAHMAEILLVVGALTFDLLRRFSGKRSGTLLTSTPTTSTPTKSP